MIKKLRNMGRKYTGWVNSKNIHVLLYHSDTTIHDGTFPLNILRFHENGKSVAVLKFLLNILSQLDQCLYTCCMKVSVDVIFLTSVA